MARLDVGRASGAGSTLESYLVVVDFIVARLVHRAAVSPSLVIAALVYQHDPAFARADSQCVAIYLHVLRRGNENVAAREPVLGDDAVMADDVVANDCVERNLVKDTDAVVALDDVVLIEHVVAVDITPQAGTEVVVDVIAAKDDTITQGDLHTTGFPPRRESADIVRPDPIGLDQDVSACACNADLAVVMNVAATYQTACSGCDPSRTVQAQFAVLDNPSHDVLSLDRPLLSDARILLDSHVSDQHVGRPALEREHGHRGFDLAAGRVVGEIDAGAGVIEVEPACLHVVLAQHLDEGLVVDQQAFGQAACRDLFSALPVFSSALLLPTRHPVASLAAKGREQATAVENRLALAVEALPRLGANGLHPVNAVLETECCAIAGAVDRGLDRGTGLHRDRTWRTGLVGNAPNVGRCRHRRSQQRQQGLNLLFDARLLRTHQVELVLQDGSLRFEGVRLVRDYAQRLLLRRASTEHRRS